MSLAQITLTTNKSISSVGDYVRKIGQGEKGQILPVLVTDANGSAYDLTGKNLVFSENKSSGAIIVDDGSDVNSGKFTPVDLKNGRFDYTLQKQVYMEDGTCWFDITNQDGTVVDTTRSFKFVVIPDVKIHVNSDSYVSSLDGLIAHVNSAGNKAIEDINNLVTQLTNEVNAKKGEADNISSQLTKKFDDKMTDLNNQLSDYQAKYNKLSTDWANELKTISDKATSDINAKYAQKLVDLQNDYDAWKAKTVADFNATVDPIKQSIQNNTADVADVTQQVQSTITTMNQLKQDLDKVDFTKFVTGEQIKNYYTKNDVDNIVSDLRAKIATAGTVKTVDNIQPDSNGNITTDHYTKSQTDQKLGQKITFVKCDSPQAAHDASMNPAADGSIVFGIYDMNDEPSQAVVGDQKINIEWLYNHLNDLSTQVSGLSNLQSLIAGKADSATVYTKTQVDQMIANAGKVKTVNGTQPDSNGNISIDLSGKADKTDITNLANRITALENKKPIKASSQDDAVAKSQNDNNEYYW
ncbi:BppU family phage baseplate upper protein [Lactobacillus amylovorus]|uniref:BppU family phage baseplate upper protein n=1 Tax=Lactobacillus amylovorus TaxID=1604 RepID=UPI003F96EDC7